MAESNAMFAGLKVGRPGLVRGGVEEADVFLTSDEKIVAVMEIQDLRDDVTARWDWIGPDDRVYVSASKKVGPREGMYYPRVALSHALNVDREAAAERPGVWNVEVFIDGRRKGGNRFTMEPGLSTLLSPVIPPDPDKWALVIGIERYSHLPAVDFALSDARKTANHFVNLLGVPERNVILLENEKATRTALSSRLNDYLPGNISRDSTLYVYFAGHGMPDIVTKEQYLAMFDSEATNITRTGYRFKDYLGEIGSLKIRKAFVFTDACFSGMASRGNRMLVAGSRPVVLEVDDAPLAGGKVVAMSATTGNQLSHAYAGKRQGLFTYFLLSGLRGNADVDGDRSVELGELYGYVKTNVERVSRLTAMEQVPSLIPRMENLSAERIIELPAAGRN